MELKQRILDYYLGSSDGINRTFMELKLMSVFHTIRVTVCINRTFMELKQRKSLEMRM